MGNWPSPAIAVRRSAPAGENKPLDRSGPLAVFFRKVQEDRMSKVFPFFVLLILATGGFAHSAEIQGNYIESRTADVFTGPCFANSEVGLTGTEAILGWQIQKGSWNGVSLDGLSVVAVSRASATLGDPFADPYPAKSVLIVDAGANAAQKQALQEFAHSMAGKLLNEIVDVESAPIRFESAMHGAAVLEAGPWATIKTRSIGEKDHLCGNEETYYDPLAPTDHAMPAVATISQYQGPALGKSWTSYEKRSAFVGTFSR
jgi:hypothetical protein